MQGVWDTGMTYSSTGAGESQEVEWFYEDNDKDGTVELWEAVLDGQKVPYVQPKLSTFTNLVTAFLGSGSGLKASIRSGSPMSALTLRRTFQSNGIPISSAFCVRRQETRSISIDAKRADGSPRRRGAWSIDRTTAWSSRRKTAGKKGCI